MATGRIRRGPRNLAAGPLRTHVDSLVLHLRPKERSDDTVTMYADAVRWFAAEHPLTGGQPTDIDIRFDADADKSADMLRFEPVRDGELVGRVHLRSWLVRLRTGSGITTRSWSAAPEVGRGGADSDGWCCCQRFRQRSLELLRSEMSVRIPCVRCVRMDLD